MSSVPTRALALGAENRDSYADFTATAEELKVSVHAAFLCKGAVYELAFHAFPFDAKYGVRDAFARYYPLYPRRFRRHPEVDPAIYGISADYGAWRISDPEACRPMNATWDWCIGAARSWGDIRGIEQPMGDGRGEYTWDAEHSYRDRQGVARHCKNAGAKAAGAEWEIARYGLGTGAFLAVNNLARTARLAELDVFPGEIASGRAGVPAAEGYLLVPFFGAFGGRPVGVRESRQALPRRAQRRGLSALSRARAPAFRRQGALSAVQAVSAVHKKIQCTLEQFPSPSEFGIMAMDPKGRTRQRHEKDEWHKT